MALTLIAPGLVRAGASRWDDDRTPIKPLSVESAYADPRLLRDLGARVRDPPGSWASSSSRRDRRRAAGRVGIAGRRAAVRLRPRAGLPRSRERRTTGPKVAGRRVLLVDDAVSSGAAVERFTDALVRRETSGQTRSLPRSRTTLAGPHPRSRTSREWTERSSQNHSDLDATLRLAQLPVKAPRLGAIGRITSNSSNARQVAADATPTGRRRPAGRSSGRPRTSPSCRRSTRPRGARARGGLRARRARDDGVGAIRVEQGEVAAPS